MRRLLLVLCALMAFIALAVPAGALADGDPGSDELVYQNLFYGADDGISNAQATQLTNLLYATEALKAPVRVAIVGRQTDLGADTSIWARPADDYAYFLGQELSLSYGGRLVVIEPKGAAFYWYSGHRLASFDDLVPGSSAAGLIAGAQQAVRQVESDAGISAARLQAAAHSPSLIRAAEAAAAGGTQAAVASSAPSAAPLAGPEPSARTSATDVSPVIMIVGLLVVLGAVFWVPPLWRRRRAVTRYGTALPGLTVAVGVLAALAVLAIVTHTSSDARESSAQTLALNPDIATPTSLGRGQRAPNFTLTDEAGRPISLDQYRGKVVILSFTDAECQTICPLTTQAMVDARDSLGVNRKDVVLLGVDANKYSTSVQDVQGYTVLHGLLGQWHFLTGSVPELEKVWGEYGVGGDIDSSSKLIEHTPAIWMIGPNGNARDEVITYPSYASIPQFGQVLAQTASGLLPSHPRVDTRFSYARVTGISPTTRDSIPLVSGGHITVGASRHVYLFFDSWDQQSTPIRGEMLKLDAYETYAHAHGLPTLVAVDEGAVEPNPEAVKTFLAGMKLNYPVAVDPSGQLADGYGVQGEPWFVLGVPSARNSEADPTATTPWEQEVYTQGWPTVSSLESTIPAALHPVRFASSSAEVRRDLAGSSAALVALHRQASEILPGGAAGLLSRLRELRGKPVVVNIWASDCGACQTESEYFAADSAQYGSKVAFLGVDYDDASIADAEGFLARHHDYYPSYRISDGSVPTALLPGGVAGLPTTLFFNAKGQQVYVHPGQYQSAAQLGSDIGAYAEGAGD